MTTDDPAGREVAALRVACPICDAERGERCQDVVRGHIGPAARPHVYRIRVAAEVSGIRHLPPVHSATSHQPSDPCSSDQVGPAPLNEGHGKRDQISYHSLWVHAKRHYDLASTAAYWRTRMSKEFKEFKKALRG